MPPLEGVHDAGVPPDGWIRATKGNPCPVCGGDHWCSVGTKVVHCMRTPSDRSAGGDAGGWLHPIAGTLATSNGRALPPVKKQSRKPNIDWATMAHRYAAEITDEQVMTLADNLGVTPHSLRALGLGYGWVPGGVDRRGPFAVARFTFPMFDEHGTVCGLRTRDPQSGEKLAVKYSKLGVVRRQRPDDGLLLVTEGESDSATALDLGYDAIGRPGVTTCADIVAAYAAGRDVVVVADNDGDNQTSAKGVHRLVSKILATAASVRLIRPPEGTKDLREWRRAGATRADVQAAIDVAEVVTAASRAGATASPKGPPTASSSERISVLVITGQLRDVITAAESALLAATNVEVIYQRGTQLARIVRIDEATVRRRGIQVPAFTPIITQIKPTFMRSLFEQVAEFQCLTEGGELKTVNCPGSVVSGYAESAGLWRVPILRSVVTSPTLRADGTVLQTPGYDAESRLLYDPCGIAFPEIPEEPTLDDARAAGARILELVQHFDFVDAGARAVWFAALLTAMVRPMLPSAPMFVIDAPTRGSGKSKLANIVGVIATGNPPATMSLVDDVDEVRKRILALLLQGTSVVNIDNVDLPIGGAALCSVLTEPTYSDRILGASEIVRVPTTSTWITTGNNVVINGDMTRRVLVCRLDPKCERPEDRHFDFDPVAVAEQNRPALVVDILTILRAHAVAGRPQCGIRPFGSFERWSEIIRAPIVWVGLPDPIAGRQAVVEQDGGAGAVAELLRAWHAAFGNRPMTTRQVLAGASLELIDAIDEVVGSDVAPANRGRRLGVVLSQWRDRIVAGYQAVRGHDAAGGTARWSVLVNDGTPAGVDSGSSGSSGSTDATRARSPLVEHTEHRPDGRHAGAEAPIAPTAPTAPTGSTAPTSQFSHSYMVGPDDGLPEQPGGRRGRTESGA